MIGIYDNGTRVLGEIDVIIRYWKNTCKDNLEELEEIMQELEEMSKEHRRAIVSIYYDNPMGYSIDLWDVDKDLINVYRGE